MYLHADILFFILAAERFPIDGFPIDVPLTVLFLDAVSFQRVSLVVAVDGHASIVCKQKIFVVAVGLAYLNPTLAELVCLSATDILQHFTFFLLFLDIFVLGFSIDNDTHDCCDLMVLLFEIFHSLILHDAHHQAG